VAQFGSTTALLAVTAADGSSQCMFMSLQTFVFRCCVIVIITAIGHTGNDHCWAFHWDPVMIMSC